MSPKRILLLVLMLLLAACNGGDGDEQVDDPATDPTTPAEEDGAAAGETVTITAVEYEFQNVPATVAAGSELTLDNQGSEPHEMTVFFVPADEERSVQELLALPEDEEPPVEFMGVAIDLTEEGSEPITPEGPVVVDQPGRYAMVCFFPTGLTDAALQEAMAQMEEDAEGPPPLPEGAPHFTEGMWAEFQVE